MKKILFVVNNFNIGGPQKSLLNLLYELENKDLDINLLILNGAESLSEYLPEKVNYKTADHRTQLIMLSKKNLLKNILLNIYYPILILKVIKSIILINTRRKDSAKIKQEFWIKNKKYLKKIDKNNYDYAIAVSGGHSVFYIVDLIESEKKVGWIRTDYRVLNRDNEIDKEYFKKLSGILSVSEMCSQIFKEIFGIIPKTFYNTLPIKLYENIKSLNSPLKKSSNNQIYLGTICRLDENKGLDLLIESAKLLKEKNINYKWFVVGNGKMEDWLKEEINKFNLKENIELLGFQFNTGEIIKEMDIIVHPSRFEGKSNTIDEALYYQKLVIATNFETVYEQIQNEINGFIVNMDSKEISDKIIFSLDTDNTKIIFKNLSSQKYQLENKGDEFLELINSL